MLVHSNQLVALSGLLSTARHAVHKSPNVIVNILSKISVTLLVCR